MFISATALTLASLVFALPSVDNAVDFSDLPNTHTASPRTTREAALPYIPAVPFNAVPVTPPPTSVLSSVMLRTIEGHGVFHRETWNFLKTSKRSQILANGEPGFAHLSQDRIFSILPSSKNPKLFRIRVMGARMIGPLSCLSDEKAGAFVGCRTATLWHFEPSGTQPLIYRFRSERGRYLTVYGQKDYDAKQCVALPNDRTPEPQQMSAPCEPRTSAMVRQGRAAYQEFNVRSSVGDSADAGSPENRLLSVKLKEVESKMKPLKPFHPWTG